MVDASCRVLALSLLLALAAFQATQPVREVAADVPGERVSLVLPEVLATSQVEPAARRGGVTGAYATPDGEASVVVAGLPQSFEEALKSVAAASIQGREASSRDANVSGRSGRIYEYRQAIRGRPYLRYVLLVPGADARRSIMISANILEGFDGVTPGDLRERILAARIDKLE